MRYFLAALISMIATVFCCYTCQYLDNSNIIMVYLLSVLFVVLRQGQGPAIVASLLAVMQFNYFFLEPRYTMEISSLESFITLSIMLLISVLLSTIRSELQLQTEQAIEREKRSSAMASLNSVLSLTRGRDNVAMVSVKHIETVFDAVASIYLPDSGSGRLLELKTENSVAKQNESEDEILRWVFEKGKICRQGEGPMERSQSSSIFLPLKSSQAISGVLKVSPLDQSKKLIGQDLDLLVAFANHSTLCMEVADLSEQAQKAIIKIENERMRNVLLSCVSHDLRTPLATITGASSSLVEDGSLEDAQKQELAQLILEESEHLNNLVRNLLEMTRLESGLLPLKKAWLPLEESIGTCLTRLERQLKGRRVNINLADRLPLIPIDDTLMQQVFLNIMENALKYSPENSEIDIDAQLEENENNEPDWAIISFSDRGPGLSAGEEGEIFGKFYRSSNALKKTGVGLGLAICKSIVIMHGGSINAANREGGGCRFTIRLPLSEVPPSIEPETDLETQKQPVEISSDKSEPAISASSAKTQLRDQEDSVKMERLDESWRVI